MVISPVFVRIHVAYPLEPVLVNQNPSMANPGSIQPALRRQAAVLLIRFQHRQKRLLRDLDLAHLLHAFLAGGLLGPQLAFAGDVAAVALGRHVLAHRGDGFPRDDPACRSRPGWRSRTGGDRFRCAAS